MKKLFMVCTLVLLVLAVSSQTQANPTITYVEVVTETTAEDVVDATSGQAGTWFLPSGIDDNMIFWHNDYYRSYVGDWGWTHTFSPSALSPTTTTMKWATLEIHAYDIDVGEMDLISSNGTALGSLTGGDSVWSTTVIDLAPVLSELLTGTIDIWMDIDSTNNHLVWNVALGSSKLTVNYETIELIPVEVPGQVIPAPGAILLSSIGVGVVGWLRRRRTL